MASSPRTEAQLHRLARLREAVRASTSYHEAVARLAAIGEDWNKASKVYKRLGLDIREDLKHAGPPYEPGPVSRSRVELVDDEPPPTLPSGEIPVYVDEGGSADNHPTTPPSPRGRADDLQIANRPGVGWEACEPEERILLVPDAHHPYVSRKAWGLMLQVARRFRPDRIVVLGDFIDALPVSDHSRDPRRGGQLQQEIDAANEALDELDALGAKHRMFCEGNHETRLYRYLCDRAPALLDTVQVERLLRLQERGWSFHRYGTSVSVGDLWITHAVNGQAGANAHERAARTHMRSVVLGHTHRIGYKVFGDVFGNRYQATMVGWLGEELEASYSHTAEKTANWAHGFGLAYKSKSGHVHVTPVPILGDSAVVHGELVSLSRGAA